MNETTGSTQPGQYNAVAEQAQQQVRNVREAIPQCVPEVPDLRIRRVLNGWLVTAGCQTIVFNNPNMLAAEFREWLEQSRVVEKRYQEMYAKSLVTGVLPTITPSPLGRGL